MAINKIELDGKTYILVPEEIYNEDKPERARTGYERVEIDEDYWAVSSISEALGDEDNRAEVDDCSYNVGNYYTDKQLAADNARADSILRRMRQWQALNDDAVQRYNSAVKKYSIMWSVSAGEPVVHSIIVGCGVDNFEIYFSTYAKAEEALEVFRDDLIWLHTQYRRRLDEVRE